MYTNVLKLISVVFSGLRFVLCMLKVGHPLMGESCVTGQTRKTGKILWQKGMGLRQMVNIGLSLIKNFFAWIALPLNPNPKLYIVNSNSFVKKYLFKTATVAKSSPKYKLERLFNRQSQNMKKDRQSKCNSRCKI